MHGVENRNNPLSFFGIWKGTEQQEHEFKSNDPCDLSAARQNLSPPDGYCHVQENVENVPRGNNYGVPPPPPPCSNRANERCARGRRPLSPVRCPKAANESTSEERAAPKAQSVHETPGTSAAARTDATTKFMAYEGACQACLAAVKDGCPEAQMFLKDGSALLRTALKVGDLLLPTVPESEGVQGEQAVQIPTTIWEGTEDTIPRSVFPPQVMAEAQHYLSVRVRSLSMPKDKKRLGRLIGRKPVKKHRAIQLKYSGQCVMASVGEHEEITGMTGELSIPDDPSDAQFLFAEFLDEENVIAWGKLAVKHLVEAQRCKDATGACGAYPSRPSTAFTNTSDKEAVISRWFNTFKSFSTAHSGPRVLQGYPYTNGSPVTHTGLPRPSGTWIEMLGNGGKVVHVLLDVKHFVQPPVEAEPVPWPLEAPQDTQTGEGSGEQKPTRGFVPVSPHQAYEYLLEASVEAQNCNSKNLNVQREWWWLLQAFASLYKISKPYVDMSHLRWIFRSGNANATVYCLELIYGKFAPMKDMSAQGSLDPHERAVLGRIAADVKVLVARVFEEYYLLAGDTDTGILDASAHTNECPPAALEPAVRLLGLTSDFKERDTLTWFENRFKAAALKKYQRFQANCHVERVDRNDHAVPGEHFSGGGSSDCRQQYKKMESLCGALQSDLNADIAIYDTGVLPEKVFLPGISAAVYCQELKYQLLSLTEAMPPTLPDEWVVDLFLAVGNFQAYIESRGLVGQQNRECNFNALQLFSDSIETWMADSQDKLGQKSATLFAKHGGLQVAQHQSGEGADVESEGVSPVVTEMLRSLETEVKLYERIVRYWPNFAQGVERAISDVVRCIVHGVSRQCGMTRQPSRIHAGSPREMGFGMGVRQSASVPSISQISMESAGPMGARAPGQPPSTWQWQGVTNNVHSSGPGRQPPSVISSREVTLLNSLRRLLVEVPQLEEQLRNWGDRSAEDGAGERDEGETASRLGLEDDMPCKVGMEFAQLAKELRSQFATAVVMSAERMLKVTNISFRTSITTVLRQAKEDWETDRKDCTRTDIQERLSGLTQALRYTLQQLRNPLEERVFVSVVRGLWDNASKELYLYVLDLKEGEQNQGAWRSRQNCSFLSELMDNFFKDQLADLLPHTLTPPDLDSPIHAAKVKEMLAQNTQMINRNFSVY